MLKVKRNESGTRWAKIALGLALAMGMMAVSLAGCSSGDAAKASSGSAASSSAASSGTTAGDQESPAAESANDIMVTVAMKESVTKSTDVDTPLQFAEETIQVKAPEGTNALEFLQATGREVEVQGGGDDTTVTAIGGLENGDAGDGSHWVCQLNGTAIEGTPVSCIPQDGDTLTWNYVK